MLDSEEIKREGKYILRDGNGKKLSDNRPSMSNLRPIRNQLKNYVKIEY